MRLWTKLIFSPTKLQQGAYELWAMISLVQNKYVYDPSHLFCMS